MIHKLIKNIEKVLVGKSDCIERLMIALLCNGHVLIEDVPGVGKTTIALALAKSLNCSFARIQFTPDLMPSDIIGISVYNQKNGEFDFKKGPIHNQIILADEINRTSPKTQSSLLEVMQEQQITVDGISYKMKEPFMVLATQNPIEYEGTFPLPEAQLDRFLIRISMGYPSLKDELEIVMRSKNNLDPKDMEPVLTGDDILEAKIKVDDIFMSKDLNEYLVNIIRCTREHEHIQLGCSPRAAIALYKASKAYAFIKSRTYVIPDDIKGIAQSVLGHRLILKPESKYRGHTGDSIIGDILKKTKIPLVFGDE